MARRDDGAFSEFVRDASPGLLRLAWLLCGGRHAAEDLVQETLERVYLHRPRIEDGRQTAFARRTLVNLNTDTYRRRRREVVTDRAPEVVGSDRTGEVDRALLLLPALAQLPTRERQCVVLRHHADLSEHEVSALLGTSVGTVKSSTSRGLARLRELLAAEGGVHV